MNEVDIIKNLKKITKNFAALSLNDDVCFDKERSLVASIDTYNENIHYVKFKNPDLIIKKAIRSSISDIISKGIDPKYILITFSGSKSNFNKKNILKIMKSINQEQKKYKFSLLGGDTSFSQKSSFTICVFSYSKRIIKRIGCFINDDIYLTGNIGDSTIGLSILKKKIKIPNKQKKYFVNKYYKPDLAYGFHRDLYKFASASMDVSDGLLIDLKKMLGNKKFGYVVDFNLLPKSKYLNKLINEKKKLFMNYLFKGDDYQILFTSKRKFRKTILKYSQKWNQKVTRIGYITNNNSDYLKFNDKLNKIIDYQGYIHNFN